MKRRNILQTSGAVIAGSAFAQPASSTSDGRFVGVAYDPVTTEIKGPVDADVSSYRHSLDGTLRFPEVNLSVRADQPFHIKDGQKQATHVFKQAARTDDGRDRSFRVESANRAALTGYVESPSAKRERTAFSLIDESAGERSDIRRLVRNRVPGGERK
jgi:hypothetical protein